MKDPRTLGTKMKDPRTLAVQTTKAIPTNTTPTNNTAQANAYNTLLNTTNVSTYDEMQPKAPKFDVQINTSAGDTGSLNTPKYQEIKNKKDNNVVKGSINSFGANLVDATVDAGQFVKNAFKSEMKKEEREAIELLIKLENGFRGSKGQMSEQQAQNAINNLRKTHKLEGLTVEQLQNRLNGIVDWTYKENALEKATSDAVKKVNEENAELGKVGQFVTSAFGTVGRMGPTIASNMILPGSGTATMFASTAQSQTEDLMGQGVNYKDAVVNGLLSGAMETGTEMLSGGISQKLTGIPALAKIGKYTDNIANPVIRGIANVGGDIVSEGLEEVAATAIQPFIDRITYNSDAPLATGEEMWSSFAQSILPTLLMQGGSVALQKVNEYNDAQKTAIENSNMPPTAKEQMIQALEEQKDKISAQINQITTQNNTNIAQTSPNNEQISQNNVQNVSNLENTVQNDEIINSQETKTKELQNAVQNYIEKTKNNFKTQINIPKIESTLNLKQESESTIYKKAKDLFSNIKKKIFVNNGENIHVTNTDISESIGKTVRNGYQKELLDVNIAVFSQLDKIIENGEKILKNVPELKNRSKYQSWDYYATPIVYNGQKYIVEFDTVIRNDGEKHFRLERVFPLNKNEEPSMDVPTQKLTTPLPEGSPINNIIPNSQNYVNNQQINLTTQIQQQAEQEAKRSKIPKLEDIADLTQKDADLPSMKYRANKDKNTAFQRKFFENMETSKIISDKVKEQVTMTTYEQKKNLETLEKVKENLDTDINKVASEWFRKDIKKATDEDVALGAILVERYQQEGMFEEAVDVVQKLADMGTEAGRTVQMYSIFQRLTPEGMMIYQQRKLNSALETLTQKQTGKWVEQNKDKFKLTEDDATFITAKVQEAQNAPTERQKQIALAEIEKRINDKLPPEAGQSVKAFRRIAMLFNPKTQVRNIAGNITVMPLSYVTDLVATTIDKAVAKKTGVRTTALPNVKTIAKGAKKGLSETIDDYKKGIRTTPTGSKYEIQNNAKSFNENSDNKIKKAINRKLNGIDRFLSAVMEAGDRPFYEAAYKNALEGQMKANGVTEPTLEMIDIASNVALSQTWQDSNELTKAVLETRNALNTFGHYVVPIDGIGLGDLIIPFAKTPANLTKAIIDYSPLAAIRTAVEYSDMRKAISRGDMTADQQKKFVTSVGKMISGTILTTLAWALVKGGKITGSSDEDKDVANFEKNVLGIQPYSIKIGDKTFTYNWANPIATPFAIMADTYKMSEEGAKWNEILVNAFKVAGDQLVANSFLQGIQELLSSEYGNESAMDNLVGAIMDLPTQFTPTLFGQIATQFDSTKRQTFENGDTVGTMWNEVKNKLPGARNTLAPQVNTFGEEIQNYGGENNPFNVFLNPGNISSTNATETQKELYKLYQDTKDKTIFPAQAPYSISGGGEKVTLSSQDRADYQKRSGQFVSENLEALFDSEYYKTLDNDKKAEVVNEIVTDANTLAKGEYLETKASKELKEKLSKLGDIPYVEYYNAWSATRGIESDKNWKGESISGSKKKKQIQAINNATSKNLTNKQRETLYGLLNVSGY